MEEIKSETANDMNIEETTTKKDTKKISRLAKASFVLPIATIPLVIICSVIIRTVIYNPPLITIARITLYMSYALIPTSLLLGIVGLIHITLKRKTYYGYWMAFIGIALSLILVVTLFYNMIRAMGEHMW